MRSQQEQKHDGTSFLLSMNAKSSTENKKLLVQKSYANVAKQSGNRQPPKKPAGARPPNTKPAGHSSTAPTLTSSVAFPELPKPPSQTEQSASGTRANSQPDKVDLTISPREQPQSTRASSSSLRPPSQASEVTDIADLFKKPAYALRSHSNSGNGNVSDESSASTSSSRSRHRPPGKKPRREDKNDEQGEDRQL
nr:nuclear transcription factor Y subunit beta-like [Aedes albopictus]